MTHVDDMKSKEEIAEETSLNIEMAGLLIRRKLSRTNLLLYIIIFLLIVIASNIK